MARALKLIIPPEEIHIMVHRIAKEIRADYASRNPLLIGVLKSSFVFLSDLMRAIKMPLEVDFLQAASYGYKKEPSRDVIISKDVAMDIKGRDVIVVEDIVDTGHTMEVVVDHLREKGPATLKLCALLVKGDPAKIKTKIDYMGVRIEKGFVVGYGLDFNEHYRNLAGIYVLGD